MPKYSSASWGCSQNISLTTVMKGSHLVPFYSTCMIIRICIIAYLFSDNTTLLKSFSYIKQTVWEDKVCFNVRLVVLSFCNCVMMQGSNVSNLVLWACTVSKRGGGGMMTSLFVVMTKFMLYKDDRWCCQVKKVSVYCDDGNGDETFMI